MRLVTGYVADRSGRVQILECRRAASAAHVGQKCNSKDSGVGKREVTINVNNNVCSGFKAKKKNLATEEIIRWINR